jgi:hypothetical protein
MTAGSPMETRRRTVGCAAENRHLATGEPLCESDFAFQVADTAHHFDCLLQEHPSKVSGFMSGATAAEQRQSHARFQLLDAAAQGRLRDVQGLGGTREAAMFGQRLRLPQQA